MSEVSRRVFLLDLFEARGILRECLEQTQPLLQDKINSYLAGVCQRLITGHRAPYPDIYSLVGEEPNDGYRSEYLSWVDDIVSDAINPEINILDDNCYNDSIQLYFEFKGNASTTAMVTIGKRKTNPTNEIDKIKTTIRNGLDNGDYYPPAVRALVGR